MLEDDDFGVFTITHKFDEKLFRENKFLRCHAIFMTCVIMPSIGDNQDTIDVGLCCDKRGDPNMILGKNINDINQLEELWGNKQHWDIFNKIKVDECPRCTYQPHNMIFEHVIENDKMTYRFI